MEPGSTWTHGRLRAVVSAVACGSEEKRDEDLLHCCRCDGDTSLSLGVRGRSSLGGLSPIPEAVRAAGPPQQGKIPTGPRLPCLGVLKGVPSRAQRTGQGGRRRAHRHGNGTSCGEAHPARVGLLSPPFLSFCETSALIRERALRMYDPCKHRVPIDQPPLLLGVCAGSRNKGRRKEGRKSPSPTPRRQPWQHPQGLPGTASSAFPIPPICLWFSLPSSLLHLPPCSCTPKMGHIPLFAPLVTFEGLFPRIKEPTCLCPTPRDVGGHSECGGVPNPPPLPAQFCVSLNNYSDESITIRPNSHSAELTQIILILCFYR